MAIIPLRIPAIGEGLQEARLVGVLKQPGERVRRDEPIYQIETDKAVMDVESPHDGVISKWLVPVDTLLPIGGEVGLMEIAEVGQQEAPAAPVSATSSTNETPLLIPQIGEGLQEARLVGVLKQPGERIRRDEPIYQIETDKAVMDVESPFDGELIGWTVAVDTVLPIGAEVGRMKVEGAVTPMAAGHGPAPAAPAAAPVAAPTASDGGPRRTDIPPRTRAYAKEKGLTEGQLQTVPASGSKLMPADIDAFLSGGTPTVKSGTSSSGVTFAEAPLSQKQRLLSSRLVRGTQLNVPGTITVQTLWEGIEARRAEYKAAGGDFQPSAFTMFAYAVAKALGEFPAFRSTLTGDSILRTYDHAQLGIAVALPGDELVLAVVPDADAMDWEGFAGKTKDQIALAREGRDQANEAVTVSLTNMQAFGLREAVPVVVPPSVATIFLSEVYKGLDQQSDEIRVRRYVNLAMTFDHRTINGVGAADFINRIKYLTENIHEVVPGP